MSDMFLDGLEGILMTEEDILLLQYEENISSNPTYPDRLILSHTFDFQYKNKTEC